MTRPILFLLGFITGWIAASTLPWRILGNREDEYTRC